MGDGQFSRQAWDGCVSARGYNGDWWDTLTPEAEPALWDQLKAVYADERAVGRGGSRPPGLRSDRPQA